MSASVSEIAERVASGAPLLEAEAITLGAHPDVVTLGMLADAVRQRLRGDRVTFVRVLEWDGLEALPAGDVPSSLGELRVGGVPTTVDEAVRLWERAAGWAGADRVTAFDLADLVERDASLRLWQPLVAAGAIHLSGATIDRLTDAVASVRAAAEMGFVITRLRVDRGAGGNLARWARVANDIGALDVGVRAFAPLLAVPSTTEPSTGYEDSKRVALARLLCDRVPSIQVDWTLYGPKLAQVALFFGADDIDRVSIEDSSPLGARRGPMEELRRNIEAAARRGSARNARFEVVA